MLSIYDGMLTICTSLWSKFERQTLYSTSLTPWAWAKEKRYNTKYYGGRAFAVLAPQKWNLLPLELRKIEQLEEFKKKLISQIFSTTDHYINIQEIQGVY